MRLRIAGVNAVNPEAARPSQGLTQERWITSQAALLLPIHHFHGVFTLPDDLRLLVKLHQRELYDALFQCVRKTLIEVGRSRLGATLGLVMVLHTWNRKLEFHPHVHVIISGGGLLLDGSGFKYAKKNYLLPKKVLARCFKGKFMAALRKLKKAGVLHLTDGAFGALMAAIAKKNWLVYLKPTFHRVEDILKYIGRYTHRVGISNSRLLDVTEEKVTFRTKDGRTETVRSVVFLQRFVQHILPDGFKKIRHAGLYANSKTLKTARSFLEPTTQKKELPLTWQALLLALTGRDVSHCKACGTNLLRLPIAPDPPLPRRSRRPRSRSPA